MIPSRPGFCVAARLGILTRQAMALHETLKIICRLSIGEAFVVLESQLGLQDWVTHSSVATGTATSPKDAHGEPSCIRSIYNQIVRCMSRQSHNVADWWPPCPTTTSRKQGFLQSANLSMQQTHTSCKQDFLQAHTNLFK